MADSRTKIRRWGLDHAQLQAELALIRAQFPDSADFDAAVERLFAEQAVKEAFRRRTLEPPKWE